MAARIRELLGNSPLADSLAHQAYMLVTARFDWQRIAAGFADRLSAVCESRAR
jgi:glycosyltransferase involved in cell wall biosynthesis